MTGSGRRAGGGRRAPVGENRTSTSTRPAAVANHARGGATGREPLSRHGGGRTGGASAGAGHPRPAVARGKQPAPASGRAAAGKRGAGSRAVEPGADRPQPDQLRPAAGRAAVPVPVLSSARGRRRRGRRAGRRRHHRLGRRLRSPAGSARSAGSASCSTRSPTGSTSWPRWSRSPCARWCRGGSPSPCWPASWCCACCLAVLRRYGYGPPPVHYLGKTATFVLLFAFPVLLLPTSATATEAVARPLGWAPGLVGARSCTGSPACSTWPRPPRSCARQRGSAGRLPAAVRDSRVSDSADEQPEAQRRVLRAGPAHRPVPEPARPRLRRAAAGGRARRAAGPRGAVWRAAGRRAARHRPRSGSCSPWRTSTCVADAPARSRARAGLVDRRQRAGSAGTDELQPAGRRAARPGDQAAGRGAGRPGRGAGCATWRRPPAWAGSPATAWWSASPTRPGRSTRSPASRGADLGRVLDRDLQEIANALWQAGAEAIAINGQRLTSTSTIRAAGEAILVDFRPVAGPYEVSRDRPGRPAQDSSPTQPPRGRSAGWSTRTGMSFEVRRRDDLTLPAASRPAAALRPPAASRQPVDPDRHPPTGGGR